MGMTPIVLWDIDGTLVRGRGQRVTMTAFVQALQVASRQSALQYPTDAHGKTDSGIALEMLAAASMGETEARALLAGFGEGYLAALREQRDQVIDDLEVLPGVREVLDELKQRQVTQSLLTGNLEPVARLKLAYAGLDAYVDFEIGAFGSDHHDRSRLVPIVRDRLRRRLGSNSNGQEIVVVGDTPRDIACARAGGARAIAVATGNFSRAELQAHTPDAVLDDLQDTQTVIELVLRYSTYADPGADTALIV